MYNQLVQSSLGNENIHISSGTVAPMKNVSFPHYHDEIEILVVRAGVLYITINGAEYAIKDNSIIVISPRIPHATCTKAEGCYCELIQFRLENYLGDNMNVGKYFNRFIQSSEMPFSLFKSCAISRVITELFTEYEKKQTEYEMVIRSQLIQIIALLMRGGILPDSIKYSEPIAKLLPSIAYIEEHYTEKITLEQIAAIQRLAPSYFCRLFKRASGTGFIEYLNFVRICKSERLLSDTDKSILEISFELGFSSVSYFNRLFKRYKNATPSEYRAAQHVSNQ